jgi:hypothetical protein
MEQVKYEEQYEDCDSENCRGLEEIDLNSILRMLK